MPASQQSEDPEPESSKQNLQPVSSKRYKYSEEEEDVIRTFFNEWINSGSLPTLCEFVEQHQIKQRTAQHIRDKVKTYIRQKSK